MCHFSIAKSTTAILSDCHGLSDPPMGPSLTLLQQNVIVAKKIPVVNCFIYIHINTKGNNSINKGYTVHIWLKGYFTDVI